MSLQKFGALFVLAVLVIAPVFVSAGGSSRDYNYDRYDRDYYYDDDDYYCDRYGTGACYNNYYDYNYGYSYPYQSSYNYPSYNYSYSYPQYRTPQYYEKSPNVSLTVLSLPNTGFEPQGLWSIAFALLVLLGIGWVSLPYVRKAFTAVLR